MCVPVRNITGPTCVLCVYLFTTSLSRHVYYVCIVHSITGPTCVLCVHLFTTSLSRHVHYVCTCSQHHWADMCTMCVLFATSLGRHVYYVCTCSQHHWADMCTMCVPVHSITGPTCLLCVGQFGLHDFVCAEAYSVCLDENCTNLMREREKLQDCWQHKWTGRRLFFSNSRN